MGNLLLNIYFANSVLAQAGVELGAFGARSEEASVEKSKSRTATGTVTTSAAVVKAGKEHQANSHDRANSQNQDSVIIPVKRDSANMNQIGIPRVVTFDVAPKDAGVTPDVSDTISDSQLTTSD